MKSIKEKAKEYGKANLTNWGVISKERVEGFEAGANYVLDSIENILNANRILGDPFPTVGMRLDIIINTIKQLKSNQ